MTPERIEALLRLPGDNNLALTITPSECRYLLRIAKSAQEWHDANQAVHAWTPDSKADWHDLLDQYVAAKDALARVLGGE